MVLVVANLVVFLAVDVLAVFRVEKREILARATRLAIAAMNLKLRGLASTVACLVISIVLKSFKASAASA